MINLTDITFIDTYQDILKTIKGNALALDISQVSTGVALWVDNQFSTKVIHTKKPLKDVFSNLNLALSFQKELIKEIPQVHYDFIVIEDIFGGQYVNTYKVLSTLAFGCDMFLSLSGYITFDHYYKIDNKVWKSKLRQLANRQDKVYAKDKEDIVQSLANLSFTKDNLSEQEKGIQDQFDATGILLVGTTLTEGAQNTPKSQKYQLNYEFLTETQLKAKRTKYELISSPYGVNHVHTTDDLFKISTEPNRWYLMKINKSGYLGIIKGFAESFTEQNYLAFKLKARR